MAHRLGAGVRRRGIQDSLDYIIFCHSVNRAAHINASQYASLCNKRARDIIGPGIKAEKYVHPSSRF